MNGQDREFFSEEINSIKSNCVNVQKNIEMHFSNIEKNIITEIKNIKIEMLKELNERDKKIARLEVKSGMWGLIGGLLAVGVYYISKAKFW